MGAALRIAGYVALGWLALLGLLDVLCWAIGSAWRQRRPPPAYVHPADLL